MAQLMIVSSEIDYHAVAVRWSVREAGIPCFIYETFHEGAPADAAFALDMATASKSAISLSNGVSRAWYRRHFSVARSNPETDEDEVFRRAETARFNNSMISLLSELNNTTWVNDPLTAPAAEMKPRQLLRARAAGLNIPQTLITANPEKARAFVQAQGSAVIKPLAFYNWHYKDGQSVFAFASLVGAQEFAALTDEDIRCCPAIYQSFVDKVADYRVVLMGESLRAYALTQSCRQDLDYRIRLHEPNGLRYELVDLPRELEARLLALADDLGVNFASMDLGRDRDGEYWFFDLNPGGQWLFLEQRCDATSLLSEFCSYFAFGTTKRAGDFPSLRDFEASEGERQFHDAHRRDASKIFRNTIHHTWKEA